MERLEGRRFGLLETLIEFRKLQGAKTLVCEVPVSQKKVEKDWGRFYAAQSPIEPSQTHASARLKGLIKEKKGANIE